MGIQAQFDKFYENIQLTSVQIADAITKHTGVCEKLHSYYYPNTVYNGTTKFLIGSYKKHTHIRPTQDVDVIFIMPPEKFPQYNDNKSNKQEQLLQDVKSILEEKYPNTPIRAFGKIVKVEFTKDKHDVELVPAWENNDGTFIIPNSENGGSWDTQDYRQEIADIANSDKITNKTKFLIRCVKKWSRNCSVKLKSFEIEKRILDFFLQNDFSGKEDSILIKAFFDYFFKISTEDILRSHLNTALKRATKACELEQKADLEKAVDEWRKIFGDDFPSISDKKLDSVGTVEEKISKLEKLYPSDKEEFLNTTYGIKFLINPVYRLKIDAYITQDGFRPSWLSFFLQKGFPLKKKKKLVFSITQKNVPSPYLVMWKVRNFGEEANNANDLRGEITYDKGSETKEENTKYYGEHYVECYIIKNNFCVVMDKILVPIDKN